MDDVQNIMLGEKKITAEQAYTNSSKKIKPHYCLGIYTYEIKL